MSPVPGPVTAAAPVHDLPPRPIALCEARTPICPRCGRVIRGVHLTSGAAWAQCQHRPPRTAAGRAENRCGQWCYLLSAGGAGDTVIVVGVTAAEHADLEPRALSTTRVLDALGVILLPRRAE